MSAKKRARKRAAKARKVYAERLKALEPISARLERVRYMCNRMNPLFTFPSRTESSFSALVCDLYVIVEGWGELNEKVPTVKMRIRHEKPIKNEKSFETRDITFIIFSCDKMISKGFIAEQKSDTPYKFPLPSLFFNPLSRSPYVGSLSF